MKSGTVIPLVGFWLAVGVVAYVSINSLTAPKVARAVSTDGRGEIAIERSYDQHFYLAGTINGHPVTFMVDTGATLVSVDDETARRVGVSAGSPAIFETAAGRVAGRIVPDVTIEAGGLRIEGLRLGVGIGGKQALLGQNFLNKLELTQSADRMVLRLKR